MERRRTSGDGRRTYRSTALAALFCAIAIAASGCGDRGSASGGVDPGKTLQEVLEQGINPNEMGMVMLLEYHRIEEREGDYTRSIENFRKDLRTLYEKGYRLVRFSDLMAGNIDVPAGTTPVVLSFDDSTEGQFRYIEKDGEKVIDPDCAVGMMKEFHEEHPDFGYTALFNFLPNLFEQPEYAQQKVDYLHEQGFEFGNHTDGHFDLGRLDDEDVKREIALPVKLMKEINPEVNLDVLCLPFGSAPENEDLMFEGSHAGNSYRNNWALLVGSNPMYPQYHYRNPGRLIPRIQVMDYNPDSGAGANGSEYWLQFFDRRPELRYISDGNSRTIAAPAYMEHRLLEDGRPQDVEFFGY